jgi:Co/Zn/Cd efflux system component
MTIERARFSVPKMDCAAEERLVRLALHGQPHVRRVAVDLASREVIVDHDSLDDVEARLRALHLGARLLDTSTVDERQPVEAAGSEPGEVRTLRMVLAINAVMFLGESIGGYLADSGALIADSLDMFADAAVYGIALYGAGAAMSGQRRAARWSGWAQMALGLGAGAEIIRRAFAGSEPEPEGMMGVALAALVANATCMWLLARHRRGGAHMKASWIFTTNDVLANLGVIAGGALVAFTGSRVPDLVIGAVIAAIVLSGATRILRLARQESPFP